VRPWLLLIGPYVFAGDQLLDGARDSARALSVLSLRRISSRDGSTASTRSFWRGVSAAWAHWCIPTMMDLWRRHWRLRRPTGRAGAQRAGVIALALLVVTAAMAVLLALSFHLAWPPVLVSIIGTVPALYLAWLAVPGVISPPESGTAERPTYGRLAGRWDPVELGVHPVIGGGPMPPYVRRPHDELLRAALAPAVAASRLVVVRGESSTGKTRAAYEAVAARLADWQVDYPLNAAALAARLESRIPARTVLWLGELRQYADDDGGAAVLGRLADLLEGTGHILITTVWPEHWTTYAAAARAGSGAADPAGVAGRLLSSLPELANSNPDRIDPGRGGVIDVPPRFTPTDLEAATRIGDPVLAAAAAAADAGQNGQVTQYLAGVPDLLDRYAGPGGNPYGQAIITAAIDATRLGHASPLLATLLEQAAVGYLTGPQRTKEIASWGHTALAWAAEELNGAVRALQAIPPPSGTGVVGYQVADYLDQHGSRIRQDQLGPLSLWDTLAVHAATARDRIRLGQAGRDRGLYRHAAALWTGGAALGNADAALRLITLLRQVNPGETMRAARWAATKVCLDDPFAIASLLRTLREAGANDAARRLASRAATDVSLDDPWAAASLLSVLRDAGEDDAGEDDAVQALASRAATHASLDNLWAAASLLRELRDAGADDAARSLAIRMVDLASHAYLDDPRAAASLVKALRDAGEDDAARSLASRAATRVSLDNPLAVTSLLRTLREAGADDAARGLASRAATHPSLDDPRTVTLLLRELREAGARQALTTLSNRAASNVRLDDPQLVASLLRELHRAGAAHAAQSLARAAAISASLDDPGAAASLVRALREAGPKEAVTRASSRAATHASLDNAGAAASLVKALRDAGEDDAARSVASRAATQVSLDNPLAVALLLRELREAGADEAVQALASRTADLASHASLDDPRTVTLLLRELREAGGRQALTALLARDPVTYASLDDPSDVAELLAALHRAGADDAVQALASRAANAGMFDLFLEARPSEAPSYMFGREPDGTPSRSWKWQAPGQ
jgi:hypothetical protein